MSLPTFNPLSSIIGFTTSSVVPTGDVDSKTTIFPSFKYFMMDFVAEIT